jgi:hypothetical protein
MAGITRSEQLRVPLSTEHFYPYEYVLNRVSPQRSDEKWVRCADVVKMWNSTKEQRSRRVLESRPKPSFASVLVTVPISNPTYYPHTAYQL